MTRKELLLVSGAMVLVSLGSAGVAHAVISGQKIPPHQPVPKLTLSPGSVSPPAGTPWNFVCPPQIPYSPPQSTSGQWTAINISTFFVASLWEPNNREFFCGYSGNGVPPQSIGMWDIESIDSRAKDCAISADQTTLSCHW